MQAVANPLPAKRKEKPKEKTGREKAIEFAKNVPRPQIKKPTRAEIDSKQDPDQS